MDQLRDSLDSRVCEFALGCAGALILEEIEMLCGMTGAGIVFGILKSRVSA
jgi:hypothetical protein